jgi:hypothetical protein
MIHLRERCPSLSDLVDLRASLRRQELILNAALHDVQGELKSWDRHRRAQDAAGREVPRELSLIWQELRERERELVLDVLQVRAALAEANREILRALGPSHGRAG